MDSRPRGREATIELSLVLRTLSALDLQLEARECTPLPSKTLTLIASSRTLKSVDDVQGHNKDKSELQPRAPVLGFGVTVPLANACDPGCGRRCRMRAQFA
jgi:hypothetical protein